MADLSSQVYNMLQRQLAEEGSQVPYTSYGMGNYGGAPVGGVMLGDGCCQCCKGSGMMDSSMMGMGYGTKAGARKRLKKMGLKPKRKAPVKKRAAPKRKAAPRKGKVPVALKRFQQMVASVKKDYPNISHREAQKMASQYLRGE